MEHWTRGRIALVGDAGAAVSLLAGEGTGLAMAEAYVLAGELACAGSDYATAFARYEARMMPFLRLKQKSALQAAATIVPKSWLGIIIRNLVTNLLPGSFVARLGLATLIDDVELPAYEAAEPAA
jgi:2-polyprenyl-6-methoxyphenol hydroxylase-like FAD-dependent oxidoreductase